MADQKKVTTAAKASKKATKKVAKKVAKKATKKVTTKAAPAARKVTKKPAKKVTKKAAAKKVTKKAAAKKVTKKVTKKAATKKTSQARKSSGSTVKSSAENKLEQLQDLLQDNLSNLNAEKAEAIAKNIWLAGLGAYSRSFNELSDRREDIQDRVEAINAEGQKVFDELVKRGKEMQGEAEKAMQQGRDTIEERVEEFKQRFGGGLSSFVDIPTRLREAAEKIEEISERLNKKK